MIGKINVGGGGAFATENDAVLRVTAPTGSTVTIAKGGITQPGPGFISSTNANQELYFFTIKAAQFDSENAWTVTATNSGSTATTTIVINSNREYNVTLSYRLPAGYQEVEYIESTGSQYLYAGVSAAQVGKGIIKGRITTAANYTALFGACNSTTEISNQQTLAYIPSSGLFYLDNNGNHQAASISGSTNFEVNFTVSGSGLSVTVNGSTSSVSGTVGTIVDRSVWLLGCNYKGTFIAGVNARLTAVAFYNRSNVMVAHLLPCYRVSDNVAGMYDDVQNAFRTNLGTGSFIVGNDV